MVYQIRLYYLAIYKNKGISNNPISNKGISNNPISNKPILHKFWLYIK